MSKFSFTRSLLPVRPPSGSVRKAFSRYLLANHGGRYREVLRRNRTRAEARALHGAFTTSSGERPTKEPLVGIVGGGFAGLFAGLVLQSLGIECEVFESSDRVGGRIHTWYSTDYDPDDPNRAGLYGEIGGMRLPQFSEDMLPVQQLALAVNSVLERNGLDEEKVFWRKFYYNSDYQRLRYNNMPTFITAENANLNSLNFGEAQGGDIPEYWVTPTGPAGKQYLPINQILPQVNNPFIAALNQSFAEGFSMLMQYDQYSMWEYLSSVFTLDDMGEYYDPAMGARTDNLPFSVVSYLETTNVGSGMYSVSFVEMVIAVYDWGGSVDPYIPGDTDIYMLTVDKGMQHFPDACRMVLDLKDAVTVEDGHIAQVQVGMLPAVPGGPYSYDPPNLTPDAQPPHHPPASAPSTAASSSEKKKGKPRRKQRVFLKHKVTQLVHDPGLYGGHGGMKVRLEDNSKRKPREIEKQYPYVITTLPNGGYLNGEFGENLLNDISFAKAQAIRECDYMASFKAFLTFKTQFWIPAGKRQDGGLGAAATDRPNRQIIYPSYGYEGQGGVLQIYCWAQDARRLGALTDEERVAECLKGIAYLYPDVDVEAEFAGYHPDKTTKTWFWDQRANGAAFALFNPGQFKNLYPTLLTPDFHGCLNFAGEACSVHHGWIVGALDSAYNAVYNILMQAGAVEKAKQMQATWGHFSAPDVATDPATDSVMDYAYFYNEVDRNAASIPPGATQSIYGDSTYVFDGNVPAFIADYGNVPDSMKMNATDQQVLQMLNDQWNANVALRSQKQPPPPPPNPTAVELLESIYYGDNFQTIPAPRFWLKDDDEFARQQLAGFMPTILTRVDAGQLRELAAKAGIQDVGALDGVSYVADYRTYVDACTVIPVGFYLPKPIAFYTVTETKELMPVAIQLEKEGELFTPGMPNAENAWLLAKMLTNCAGQSLHDVAFHQLMTHQLCAMVSIALFSEEVFNPLTPPGGGPPFQEHPVFKLLRPHVVKTVQFQQTIYNSGYDPYMKPFPATRDVNGSIGVYNIGFVYDLIFSCGRIGNYQLQDRMYNDGGKFRFLEHAIPIDARSRGVAETPFSYAYVHDATLWYDAMAGFVSQLVDVVYADDPAVANDVQLQRFFGKLIPAFNYVDGTRTAQRFPDSVVTKALLKEVLTMFVWQFSVEHTVMNDGAYDMAAFVPNASTLMFAPPAGKPSSAWTPQDVLACMPSQTATYPSLGNMNFMDVQINASVTGQGPYPSTITGRGVLEPSIDFMQDTYGFTDASHRNVVDNFFQATRAVGNAIQLRQARDTARYLDLHPGSKSIPETVVFDLITPVNVMNTIQT